MCSEYRCDRAEGGMGGFDAEAFKFEPLPEAPEVPAKKEKAKKEHPDGAAPEEVDRLKAREIRGEYLTEAEFAERAKSIAKLREAVDAWAGENVPEGKPFDNRALIALVEYLSEEHAETVEEITKHFDNKDMYPRGRQVVKLRRREVGVVPDVFLFGWRGDDETRGETKIHDHADSTVAVKVHEGEVQETVFRIDRKAWLARQKGQTMGFEPPPVSKRYKEGMSKSYKSPYLHTIGGTPEKKRSVTIHAYWRPSEDVAYDFAVKGDKLVELGVS